MKFLLSIFSIFVFTQIVPAEASNIRSQQYLRNQNINQQLNYRNNIQVPIRRSLFNSFFYTPYSNIIDYRNRRFSRFKNRRIRNKRLRNRRFVRNRSGIRDYRRGNIGVGIYR